MSKCLVNFYLIAPRAGVSKSELVTWYSTFEHFWMMSHHSLSCWCPVTLKGIVHPKCLILSSFTPSSSSSKPAFIYLFCWTQRKIFWRKFVTRLFWGNIDLHNGGGGGIFFRISSFVFSRTNKFMQVWNYLRMSKRWQNFHFWVNYPFKD